LEFDNKYVILKIQFGYQYQLIILTTLNQPNIAKR